MMEIRKTETFAKWLDEIQDIHARARILVRIERLSAGNPGDVKPVGEDVSELRIDYGSGYRVYYKKQGRKVIILLARGEKHSQAKTARVTLEPGPRAAAVRVSDDGVGLPEEAEARPGHYGLRGLRERVEGLGGAFTAARAEPAGTTIETRIPLITA